MSTRVTRNSSRFKGSCDESTNKNNTETDTVPKVLPTKLPIIAPNGKIFYPCQYCSKVFQRKLTGVNHMKKCKNSNTDRGTSKYFNNKISDNIENRLERSHANDDTNVNSSSAASEYFSSDTSEMMETHNVNDRLEKKHANKLTTNNSNKDNMETGVTENNSNFSENNNENPNLKIFQDITLETPKDSTVDMNSKQPSKPNDISIYDYNEDGISFSEVDKTDSDKKCKQCHKFFENPLDLLRHSRTCRNIPIKILPPEEVEKYFDSPNRNFCPICEKPIKTKNFRSIFIKHLLVHTVGLSHECNICKKKFKRRDHMKAHHKRHIVCF
ncbi:uncharacterized protein [Leptinotarsa decemlineata]|uniref:uncharacterized protein n=1 Tax=Leptinotarsa decemlineata TaxID=7539 RepID=UPI000C252EC1|nr:putative uncharacterized protein DDB_G0282133 [Leptinotarsa decemlineata]